jgi:UDP-3-O-[3-hydroxymyristoyl] glucosamine N-acyltransferase
MFVFGASGHAKVVVDAGMPGIGDNAVRAEVARRLVEHDCALARVVPPSADIGREVVTEDGTVVIAGCVINSGTRVGRNVIVNTRAMVVHAVLADVPGGARAGGSRWRPLDRS